MSSNDDRRVRSPEPLADTDLDQVQGGNSISIKTKLPNYQGPKVGAPSGSIAQGDTIDNEDNLPG